MQERQSILSFFADKTVMVTGGTGYLGKVLIEKLLRSCPDLKRIYVLARSKKGKNAEKRLEEFCNNTVFDRLKSERADALRKVFVVSGDCELKNLGLTSEDRELLVKEVEVVFHLAATVRFDEKLQKAAYINVRATRDLLEMSRTMSKLRAFVHVSTAFSFCPQPVIDETFYTVPLCAHDLLTIVDTVSEDQLNTITSAICKPWPNTYSFTKAIAEDVIRREGTDLPVAIVRPSIILSSIKEPVEGWIDNIYGPTSIFLGISLGVIRTCLYEENCVVDQIPVDFVANNLIAVAWSLGLQSSNEPLTDIPIYNCVSTVENPVTWGECESLSRHYANRYPSIQTKWHRIFKQSTNMFTFTVFHALFHLLPAYIGDFVLALLGNKPTLVKLYQKIEKNIVLVSYFTLSQWIFKNNNNKDLLNSLGEDDRRTFDFNVKNIKWDAYVVSYVKGARRFLLNETLDTLPQARRKAFVLKIVHYLLVALVSYFLIKLLSNVFAV